MRRVAGVVLFALWPAALGAQEAGQGKLEWKLSGYYKNLATRSRTVLPAGEPYIADLNRFRLKIDGRPAADVAVDLQYDNEVLVGSYLRTSQFQWQKEQPPPTYWRAQSTYADRGDFYGQHRLYRATVTWSQGATDVRIGRQRIAWGTGRFFSPLDILNPLNPITLERGERMGVDALLVEHKVDALSRFSAVYAPQHALGTSSAAALWHSNYRGMDYSIVGGRYGQQDVVGVDLAGQLGQAGIRAEATHSRRRSAPSYTRALIGLDYAFANKLSVSGELYHDGSAAREPRAYDFAALLTGTLQNLGRRYAAVHASYAVMPLLEASVDLVANLGDRGYYLSPRLTYSIQPNLEAAVGVQLFRGHPGGEYGAFKDGAFAMLVLFF